MYIYWYGAFLNYCAFLKLSPNCLIPLPMTVIDNIIGGIYHIIIYKSLSKNDKRKFHYFFYFLIVLSNIKLFICSRINDITYISLAYLYVYPAT